MPAFTGQYYTRGTAIREAADFNPALLCTGTRLYEVLRVQEGICLFLEDHLDRLQESVNLSGFDYQVLPSQMHDILGKLIRKNALTCGNIKVDVQFSPGVTPVLFTYFIPHLYPSAAMYAEGVDTGLLEATRQEPNVKKLSPALRKKAARVIREGNLYEVLLLNEAGRITEGSKSNVFFIRRNQVLTPPGEQVLKGITRQKVIGLCNRLNYNLIEDSISIDELGEFEAAFLTGTSPKVLPVRRLGKKAFLPDHPVTRSLAKAYDELITEYILQHGVSH